MEKLVRARCCFQEAKVRILMLSWEYPPRIVGKSPSMSRKLPGRWQKKRPDLTSNVVTCDFPNAPRRRGQTEGSTSIAVAPYEVAGGYHDFRPTGP